MGKSPEAMKSKENYEKFHQIVLDTIRKEKEKEELERLQKDAKKK